MHDYFSHLLQDIREHWLIYSTMPFVAALIGYTTKLVAVEMMFRPLEFRGFWRIFGWQGVIPRYAPRMASTAMDLMLDKLVQPREIMARIDTDQLIREVQRPLLTMTDELTRALMAKYHATIWEAMPEAARRLLIRRVQAQAPAVINRMMDQLRTNLEEVLDIKAMAVEALVRDKALLVRLVRNIGDPEMRFIVRSGLVFGFLLGIAQALLWAATHEEWLMPAFGFFVGYFTDWLGLTLIFRPIRPWRLFGFRIQGLFHKRRAEVAEDYGDLIAEDILSAHNVVESLLRGPQADRLFQMIAAEVSAVVDQQSGFARPLVVLMMGGHRYQEMKQDAVSIALESFPDAVEQVEQSAMEAVDLRSVVKEKMGQMTPDEYEGLLRPAFKQDEWKLVLVGGILGGLIGELQVLLFLH